MLETISISPSIDKKRYKTKRWRLTSGRMYIGSYSIHTLMLLITVASISLVEMITGWSPSPSQ